MESNISQDAVSLKKDCRDIKRNIKVIKNDTSTYLVIVAVASDVMYNSTLAIPAIKGAPIQNGVYDIVRDCYVIEGIAFEQLGEIPISYSLLDAENESQIDVAIPAKVISRYLNEKQKKIVSRFILKNKQHKINYIQFRSAY